MSSIQAGSRVRIKDRDWFSLQGYRFANAEGTVIKWVDYDEVMKEFQEYVHVRIEKAEGDAGAYMGNVLVFHTENLEKI